VIEFSVLTECRGRLPCSQSITLPDSRVLDAGRLYVVSLSPKVKKLPECLAAAERVQSRSQGRPMGRRKLKRDRSQQLLVAQTLAFCRWWLSAAAAPTSTAKEIAAITSILFMLATIITKILVSQKSFWPTGDRRSSPSAPMRFQPDPL
jgi:hypothetical protein